MTKKTGKKARKSSKRRKPPSSKFPLMQDSMQISLRHCVRSQISGTAYSVFNFEGLALQTLQPMYRDQLLALWLRYVVLGITVEHRLVNKSSTVDMECLTYHGNGNTVVALTFAQALEYKYTQRRMLTTSGNGKTLNFSQTVWFGSYLPKQYFDDSNFWGTASAAPPYCSNDGYQYAIGFLAADGTSSMNATLDRRITFHVKFHQLANISNSLFDDASQDRPVLQYLRDADETSPVTTKKITKPKK